METKTKDSITQNLGENPFPTAKRMALDCCHVSHFHKTLSHYLFYEIDFGRRGEPLQEDELVITLLLTQNL